MSEKLANYCAITIKTAALTIKWQNCHRRVKNQRGPEKKIAKGLAFNSYIPWTVALVFPGAIVSVDSVMHRNLQHISN